MNEQHRGAQGAPIGRGEQHARSWPPVAPVEAQKEADTAKKKLLMFYPRSSSTVTFFVCANWWRQTW